MAATNFTPISLYYSATTSAAPSAGNLVAGELALNTVDEKLYFKNSTGTVKLLASNAGSAGSVTSVAMTVPSVLSISGSPITSSGTLALTYSGTALPVANGGTGITSFGTGVATALGVNTGTAGAFVVNGGALGSPSTAGTIPAFTLGGTVSGGGNNINNVIIGASGALAGSFTTLSASSTATAASFIPSGSTVPTNGVYLPAANTVGVATNSTAAAKFSRSGTAGWGPTINVLSMLGTGVDAASVLELTVPSTTGANRFGTIGFINAATGYGPSIFGFGSSGDFTSSLTFQTYNSVGTGATPLTLTNAGAAVTGTLSATGTLSGGTSGTAYSFSGSAPAGSLTLDSSGKLLVGTTSAVYGGQLSVKSAGATALSLQNSNFVAATSGTLFNFDFGATTGNTYAAMQVTSGGGLAFNDLVLQPSGGNLLVGDTSAYSGSRLSVKTGNNNGTTHAWYAKNSSATVLGYQRDDGLFNTGAATNSPYNFTTGSAANLFVDASGTFYRSTSSLKYKTNVQDATHGLAALLQLRSVTYEGKAETDAGKTFGGLIAEEVHAVGLTEFVQYAEDGSPDALAYGNMVSLCIKAIQEQQALITQLTARITALETT